MFDDKKGPIEHFSWAKFIINGKEHSAAGNQIKGVGKDIRLIGEKVSEWKERKGHSLSPEMITGIYKHDIHTLVIGVGVEGLLKVPKETRQAIEENGVKTLVIEKTPEACRIYNELYHKGVHVALLAHGTC